MGRSASHRSFLPVGLQAFDYKITRRSFIGGIVASPSLVAVGKATAAQVQTDLIFDPDFDPDFPDEPVIRVLEVEESLVAEPVASPSEFDPPKPYLIRLGAFGPATTYELKIFDSRRRYDLIFKQVQLGEWRGGSTTFSFSRADLGWTVSISTDLFPGTVFAPISFADFRAGGAVVARLAANVAQRGLGNVFDGHLKVGASVELKFDANLVWTVSQGPNVTSFGGAALLSGLAFYWARTNEKVGGRAVTEFVASASASVRRVDVGDERLRLALTPLTANKETVAVSFFAGTSRKGINPRIEVRLECDHWLAVFSDQEGVAAGPIGIKGSVVRQLSALRDDGTKAPRLLLTSAMTAGLVHETRPTLPKLSEPVCVPALQAEPNKDLERYAVLPSSLGMLEVVSPESEQEADDAELNGAERPFWVFAFEDDKQKLAIAQINVSLLLRRAGTALAGAHSSNLTLTDTSFQLLYRLDGNLQLPSSYLWIGDPKLIEPSSYARIDLSRANLRASRTSDLMSLDFRFSDLCLAYRKPRSGEVAGAPAMAQLPDTSAQGSVQIEPLPDYCRAIRREGETDYHDTRPILVVEFPPQHVMEEAIFRQELPPIPARSVKTDPETFKLDGGDSRDWWRDPQKLASQLDDVPRDVREKVRARWFEATKPADDTPADQIFRDFHDRFAAKSKSLPPDQQQFIGPFGLDADGMAIARRLLADDQQTFNQGLVDEMFAEVAHQYVALKAAPASRVSDALAVEHQLEAAVPPYQLFRDFYRQVLIDARLGNKGPLDGLKVPADLSAAEIEFFCQLNRQPLDDGGADAPYPAFRLEIDKRDQAARTSYVKAIAVNSKPIPEILRGRLAERSRLAFRVNCGPQAGAFGKLPEGVGRDHIAFSLDGLTDWSRHELAVIRRSQRLFDPDSSGLLPPPEGRKANEDDIDLLLFQGIQPGPYVTPQQRLGAIATTLQKSPTPWETAIDLPARLTLSTAQDAIWRTPKYFDTDVFWRKYGDKEKATTAPEVRERGGRSNVVATGAPHAGAPAVLWAAGIDPEADDPGLRVIYSPDFRPEFLWSRSQRQESRAFFGEGSNLRLPGNGAPPRGPLAPWLIGREQTNNPTPDDAVVEQAYRDKNPGITPEDQGPFIEDCPPADNPRHFWLSISKFLFHRKKVTERYGRTIEFRTSLDAFDRHELVLLSSAYGLPVLGRRNSQGELIGDPDDKKGERLSQFEPARGFALEGIMPGSAIYRPRSLDLRELSLTALGGTLRHDTHFVPPASAQYLDKGNLFDALSIERWQHWAVLGRDVFSEVVYKGFLFPLGHRASLVKLTERVFMRATSDNADKNNGAVKAFLRQRMYIRVGHPDKEYPAVGQPNGGRQFPVSAARILTGKTPDIVDPMSIARGAAEPKPVDEQASGRLMFGTAPGLAFWPRTAMTAVANVMFDVAFEGRVTRMPLIFVDNTAAHDGEAVGLLADYYNAIASPDASFSADKSDDPTPIERLRHLRTATFAGQSLRYCDERKAGDSSHETDAWTLKVQGRRSVPNRANEGENKDYTFDPVMEGADQPPFYPAMESARILLRQTERFTGRPATPSVVQFDAHYIANGFAIDRDSGKAKDNESEIYLNLVRAMRMTIGNNGDRSGGMFRPESDYVALSRLKGPMGGSPEPRDDIPADPKIVKAGELITRSDNYGSAGDATKKLIDTYRRYFAFDTKLLGMIRLDKLLKYMGLPTPEEGVPLLKEAIDYGIAQLSPGAAEAAQAAVQTTAAGRTLVQDEVIGPLLKVVEDIQADWTEAQKTMTAAQARLPDGKPVKLETLFPEIGSGIEGLKRALRNAMGTKDLILFFASLAEIHEAGRQIIEALKRVAANPLGRVDAALREKISLLTDKITGAFEEAKQELQGFVADLQKSAVTFVVVGLVPGADNDPALSFGTLFPHKPKLPAFQTEIDTVWAEMKITNAEARTFLTEVFKGNDKTAQDALLKVVIGRLSHAKSELEKQKKEELDAIANELGDAIAEFQDVVKGKFGLDAVAAAIWLDVEFVKSAKDNFTKLEDALDARKPEDAAVVAAELIKLLAGPIGLSDKVEDVEKAINAAFNQLVKKTQDALSDATVWGATGDNLLDRLQALVAACEAKKGVLTNQLQDLIKKYPDAMFKDIKDQLPRIIDALGDLRIVAEMLHAALKRDAAATKEILASVPKDINLFVEGGFAAALQPLQELAESKAALVKLLTKGFQELGDRSKALMDLIVGTTFPPLIGPVIPFTDNAKMAEVKQAIADLDKAIAQALARGLQHAISALALASSAAKASALPDNLNAISQLLPVSEIKTRVDRIRQAALGLSTSLDSLATAASQIKLDAATLKDLLGQPLLGQTLLDLLRKVIPGLAQDLRLVEDGLSDLVERSGRALIGLGSEFLEKNLAPVVKFVLGGFDRSSGNHVPGVAEIFKQLVEARNQAITLVDGSSLPKPFKDELKQRMKAERIPARSALPPVTVTAEADQLDIDQLMLNQLSGDDKVISSAANRRWLLEFIKSWEAANASPLVIAHQIESYVVELLRGEWYKLVDIAGIRSEVERYIKSLIPLRARLAYTFGAPMTKEAERATGGIFIPEEGSRLDISVAASVEFQNPENVQFEANGIIGRFGIKLVGDLVDAVTINFHGATFKLAGSAGPTLNVMYDNFVIGKDLEFVQELASMLGPKNGSGFYLAPRFDPIGIEAGYGLALPIITLGNVSFSNVSLNAAVVIPFNNSDARFRASLSRRDAPFTIAVAPYGGSGFFAIEANAEGIVGFEASFQFGGAAAFQFGPLIGIGRLMLGVYIKQTLVGTRRSTEITGTFFVGGAAAIWIFTFGASLYVRLGMVDGAMTGVAIFTFSFSLGIADYDYSLSVNRTENKMGSGQQSSIAGGTRIAALGSDLCLDKVTKENEFGSWIVNRTKCQGIDWTEYRGYFDSSIEPFALDAFEAGE